MTLYDNVNVIMMLKERGVTLSVAESCTGGLLAKYITDIPGASSVFKGGVVSYTNDVKEHMLDVPRAVLENCGAVSKETACAMAIGVRCRLNSSIGVSTTGLVGPDGDDRDNPVGLVFVALDDGKTTYVHKLRLYSAPYTRSARREAVCRYAISMVAQYLNGCLESTGVYSA